jgi:hypothetical protein
MRAVAHEVAFVILTIDHRVAFLALAALVVAAGIPLAFAWARVMPEDRPPFQIEPPSYPSVEMEPAHVPLRNPTRNPIAIVLLVCVTIAYLVQFPGVPREAIVAWLNSSFAESSVVWVIVGVKVLVIMAGGSTVYYGIVKPGPLRWPLISAGALILIQWLVAALLRVALLASS